jgi:hypothetical protein
MQIVLCPTVNVFTEGTHGDTLQPLHALHASDKTTCTRYQHGGMLKPI